MGLVIAVFATPAWSQTPQRTKAAAAVRLGELRILHHPAAATSTLPGSRILVGGPVTSTQFKAYDSERRDGSVLIDVVNFTRRGHGAGITVYPFG